MALYFQQSDAGGAGCAVVIVVVIIVIVIVVNLENAKKQKQLDAARQAYQDSLALLKTRPTSADLRARTLELGRNYSNLTRDKKGVTVFDEVALSNDIGAACAAAAVAPPVPAQAPVASSKPSIHERLRQLDELRNQALINDSEYAARREKILDEV